MEPPITPPPELRRLWAEQAQRMDPHDPVAWLEHVANQAAHWGADQELEACCEWLRSKDILEPAIEALRDARRPKPPSLAEEALTALDEVNEWAVENMRQFAIHDDLVAGVAAIRYALERLQELESDG